MKLAAGGVKKSIKHLSAVLAVFLGVAACGPAIPAGYYDNPPAHTNHIGGGGGVATVRLTGTLSVDAAAKPSIRSAQDPRTTIAGQSWGGATLQVIDSNGVILKTTMVKADGSYSVDVPPGTNYFIRVQSGNLVMKTFLPSVTANAASVNVDATTTAQVLVLGTALGVANAGEPSVSTATAIASADMTAVIAQTKTNPRVATLAFALAMEVFSGSYNATATTATLGSASAAGAAIANTVASTVSGLMAPKFAYVANYGSGNVSVSLLSKTTGKMNTATLEC